MRYRSPLSASWSSCQVAYDRTVTNEVLAILWSADGPLTPSEVLERHDAGLAYTTVMTILARLHQKGLVDRRPRGRAFEYSAVDSEADFGARQLVETLAKVSDRPAVLSRFVGRLSTAEAKELRAALEQRKPRK